MELRSWFIGILLLVQLCGPPSMTIVNFHFLPDVQISRPRSCVHVHLWAATRSLIVLSKLSVIGKQNIKENELNYSEILIPWLHCHGQRAHAGMSKKNETRAKCLNWKFNRIWGSASWNRSLSNINQQLSKRKQRENRIKKNLGILESSSSAAAASSSSSLRNFKWFTLFSTKFFSPLAIHCYKILMNLSQCWSILFNDDDSSGKFYCLWLLLLLFF